MMAQERLSTSLIGGSRLTADELRNFKIPTQLLGGYSIAEVDRLMGRTARELSRLYGALEEAEHARVTAEQATQQFSVPQPLSPDQQVTRVLHLAQQSADALLAESRHQADTMLEHARQQAERVVAEARQHASASARQIIENATAESRHQVAHYLQLADTIRKGLAQGAGTLHTLLGEWMQAAGPEVPASAAPAEEEIPLVSERRAS